jgi:hypothetical protein
MAKIQLITNLIAGGVFYPFDSVIEEEIVPEHLRTPAIIKPPGPPPEAQWDAIPSGVEGEDENEEQEQEEERQRPARGAKKQ